MNEARQNGVSLLKNIRNAWSLLEYCSDVEKPFIFTRSEMVELKAKITRMRKKVGNFHKKRSNYE